MKDFSWSLYLEKLNSLTSTTVLKSQRTSPPGSATTCHSRQAAGRTLSNPAERTGSQTEVRGREVIHEVTRSLTEVAGHSRRSVTQAGQNDAQGGRARSAGPGRRSDGGIGRSRGLRRSRTVWYQQPQLPGPSERKEHVKVNQVPAQVEFQGQRRNNCICLANRGCLRRNWVENTR